MIASVVQQAFRRLTHQSTNSIVQGFKRSRTVYDTMSAYNEEWVPRQNQYHKSRKPRQEGWTDPNKVYPQLITPIRKMKGNPRNYLKEIEQEEKQKIERTRNFLMPDVRSGDIVEISYQQTFESDKLSKYRGFVIGMTKRNSLMAGMILAIRLAGVNIQAHYLINSPKVKNIEIVSRGSGDHKARLYFLWQRRAFTKSFINHPWKGKANKKRYDDRFKKTSKKPTNSLIMDKTEDDTIRRVL